MARQGIWLAALLMLVSACRPVQPAGPEGPAVDDGCQATVEALEFQVEDLARRSAELEAWAELLAGSYGPGVWYFNPDGTQYPVFHHTPAEISLEGIAAELNQMLSEEVAPQIILDGVEGSTARVRLSDDAALTQRLGSSGAQAYLQVVLYSLTSLPGIDCVAFDFVEGDHAQPGLYCR